MGNSLAIDLASKRYGDYGIAFLEAGSRSPELLSAADLSLENPPEAETLAHALNRFSRSQAVNRILLDGPQAWRHPSSPIEHMRLCERVLNTPAKTGTPGNVKPKTYLHYVQFSINLFQHLRIEHGWSLLTHDWASGRQRRWLVEVYPSAAWSLQGLKRLPGKGRARGQLGKFRESLARATDLEIPSSATHDELQAMVVLPLASALELQQEELVLLAGVDPIVEDETVFEGLIACPRIAAG